jgi:hypothetical protein
VLLDSSLKCGRVSTHNLADLLAVFEKQESGHGAYGQILSDFRNLVDIELVEAGLGVNVGEPVSERVSDALRMVDSGRGIDILDDLRRDDLAWTAPGGEAVKDHQALLTKRILEIGLPIWYVNLCAHSSTAREDRMCTYEPKL